MRTKFILRLPPFALKAIKHRDPNIVVSVPSNRNGKAAGEDEGGGVRAVAVPAEGDAWAVEGPARQDPTQGLRELAQRRPPPHPPRQHIRVIHSITLLSICFTRSKFA